MAYLSKAVLQEKLDALGVEYDEEMTQPELLQLWEENATEEDEVESKESEESEEAAESEAESDEAETETEEDVAVEEPEAEEAVESEESTLSKEDVITLPHGALMKQNVKHNGVLFKAGEAVDLEDAATHELFAKNGWIE